MNEYIQEVIHHITVARNEKINDAILCEINEIVKDNELFTNISLNEKAIVMALSNTIPSKPFIPWDSIRKLYSCPACIMSVSESDRYCSNCGKKLDWSDC